jgi:glycosyltransferase involved in cell wall biosynthesis
MYRLRKAKWRTEYLRYNQNDGMIVVGHILRQRLIDLGIDKSKIHVIACGVDVPRKPKEKSANQTVRCLAVGRMVAKKAPILTLDAFRRAAAECPNLHLDYVGTGELLPAAKQFVQAFDLGNKVQFYGGRSSEDIQRLMDEADIFLQHSMTDPETGTKKACPSRF